ncbi:MAG TPA: glycosyltransferase [Candidatus Acidoferrales bacterium]|nr:glycosyltransferase [Candidatus Acidoferrales bacterium]
MRPFGKLGLQLSVIVSTYNNPRALQLVMVALARQSVRDFELVIADDGSAPETKAVIDRFASSVPFAVQHVWQPDDGFRKCAILNKAIVAARGTYLIFFDGDCIAPRFTVEAHATAASRGTYLTGGKVHMDQRLTDALTVDDVASGKLDRFGWWWRDVEKRRRLFVSRVPGLRGLLDRNVKRQPAWRGENSSTFAEHLHSVGGFDERFTYGLEDADLGHRMQAAGFVGRSLRYTAPVFHLEHGRPYVRDGDLERNRALFQANRAGGVTRTPYGLQA